MPPVVAVVLSLLLLVPVVADAEEGRAVRIGVLSHRGFEATMRAWSPTARYLTTKLPTRRFEIVPLDFQQIGPAVEGGAVDFVLTNPGIYVSLELAYGVSRIATLNNRRGELAYNLFGGVIFCRADRTGLDGLESLRGRRFAAVDESSLGGFQMAWRELREAGIDPFRDFSPLEFLGTHDEVVTAVRDGWVDAGAVRTDILERMADAGVVSLADFRVLNPQHHPDFPFLHSTRLYPEWPFAKLRQTPNELAQQVAVALLGMAHEDPAALAGKYAGWTVPLDYQPVHELFRELRLGPYRGYGAFTLADVVRQYWYWLVSLALSLTVMGVLTLWVLRLNNELKRAKLGLERQNELLLKAVGDGIYGVDLNGNCTFVNPALERITGWRADELIGLNQHELLHHTRADGSHYPTEECPVFATFRENIPYYVDNDVFWRKDGTSFPVEYISTPIKNERGDTMGAVVVFRDVTRRRQAEEHLRQHQAELAHAARLSTMGELASGMAHELNQPLAAIANYTSACIRMLKGGTGGPEELLEAMGRVAKQAERAGEIIRQIRGFIRKEAPHYRWIDLNTVACQAVMLIEPEARKAGIALRLQLADGLPKLHGYDIQLEQVILNLVRNAIEAMAGREGGEVTIRTGAESAETVELAVRDQGHGLTEEALARLFEPFYTTKSSGMGLGLSICRAIIESHGGQLSAAPNPEGGATFRFTLMAAPGPGERK